jgi:hypothetical protein
MANCKIDNKSFCKIYDFMIGLDQLKRTTLKQKTIEKNTITIIINGQFLFFVSRVETIKPESRLLLELLDEFCMDDLDPINSDDRCVPHQLTD